MLFVYFLKHFYRFFFLAFGGLTFLFALANFYMSLPALGSLHTFTIIFWNMLPITSFFALPLSSCFAVHATVASMFDHHEIELLYFLSQARHILYKAILFFSISLSFFYIPLIFKWGPQSYASGKRLLFTFAKKELNQLAPQTMHTIFPSCSLFFKNKEHSSHIEPIFHTLLLFFKKNQDYYFLTAKLGLIQESCLILKNGSIYNNNDQKHHYAVFDYLKIDLNNFFYQEKGEVHSIPHKFLQWNGLLLSKKYDKKIYNELHKRGAQILWQLIIPFLGYFGVFLFRQRYTLVNSFLFSGFLFLLIYIFLTLGQLEVQSKEITLLLFYLPPVLLSTASMYIYYRKM